MTKHKDNKKERSKNIKDKERNKERGKNKKDKNWKAKRTQLPHHV